MSEDCILDAAVAAQIIRTQFPGTCSAQVSWLNEGYDSTAFEAGGEWMFRFPKRSDVEQQLLLELRLLPILARQSPLPLPLFCFCGAPSPMYPHCFGGYRKIPGVRHPGSIVEEAGAEAIEDFEHVRAVAPDGPLDEWLELITKAPTARSDAGVSPAMVHGDFAAEHVLFDATTGSITGVIDWSEVTVGDPSLDLAGIFHWGGERLLDAVLLTYDGPTDEPALHRARYLAACRGVSDVVFGRETGRREYVEAGVRALEYAISSSGAAV